MFTVLTARSRQGHLMDRNAVGRTLTRMTLASIGMISLSACATAPGALDDHSDHFGYATAVNANAQHVVPTAKDKANTFIPANRSRKNMAIERYNTDTVEAPIPIKTNE